MWSYDWTSFECYLADTWRNNNVISMSKRLCDVVLTYYCVMCPLGKYHFTESVLRCTSYLQNFDGIQNLVKYISLKANTSPVSTSQNTTKLHQYQRGCCGRVSLPYTIAMAIFHEFDRNIGWDGCLLHNSLRKPNDILNVETVSEKSVSDAAVSPATALLPVTAKS